MNRKKVEMICLFLVPFFILGVYLITQNESSLIGKACLAIGICAIVVRSVLVLFGAAFDTALSMSTKKEFARKTVNNKPAKVVDEIIETRIKKYILQRAGQGMSTMADQKRLVPSLIKLVPRLSVLESHSAFKRVEEGRIDDAHGIGELIDTTESILRQVSASSYYDKWKELDNDTLLNAYLLLDYYLFPLKGSAPGIRTAKYVLSKVLIERLPQLEIEDRQRIERECYEAEHIHCSRCNTLHIKEDMHYVDGRWLCHNCFNAQYGSFSYEM